MHRNESPIANRLNILFFLVFIIFTILLLRLAGVQLVKGEEYLKLSQINSTTTLSLTAPRGWITDRNGELLVSNRPAFVVTFTEVAVPGVDYDAVAEMLADLLVLDKKDVLFAMDFTAPRRLPRFLPRQIKTDVDEKIVAYIAEHQELLPGVDVIVEPIREYRYNNLAVHALGYISPIPEVQRDYYRDLGYRIDERVGIDGIEKHYEQYLRGIAGERVVEVNRFSQPIRELSIKQPERGNDLTLTIDLGLQATVESILFEQLEILRTRAFRPIPDVNEAVAVAMNPINGEIYAMASYPSYDPNVFSKRPLTQETVDYLFSGDGELPLLNRAVDAAYMPGSVVKMATIMMGLQENLINQNTRIYDSGSILIGTWPRPFRSWAAASGGHGWNDPKQAIQVSNNVYMYHLAQWVSGYPNAQNMNWSRVQNAPVDLRSRLKSDWQRNRDLQTGIDIFADYYAMFGLGVKTEIDLPKDSRGFVNITEIGELAYAAIGQNMTLTAMQLAQYTSTIANGGERVAPYLVKKATDSRGNLVFEKDKEILNTIDIAAEHIKFAQEGMRMVMQPGGTAYNSFLGFSQTVAGKTGTAQTGVAGETNATFVGYAPYDNPEIAVAVIVPKGGGGSDVSASIARRIMEAYFELEK